jgi:O-succinylbenzoic acid--CoA ligase
VIQTCIDHKITHLSLVPTQLYRLLNTSPLYIKQIASMLQGVLLGGSALSEALLKKALQSGLKVIPTYGMTEMSSQITMDRVPSYDGPVTAGTPLPGVEIKLSEDQEILVRGKNLFQGYWDVETQSLRQPLTSDGWFATKDLGAWTPEGKLQLIGRKDNLFISGGENIQPEEIEAILCKFPGILQALVVPISDAEFGARPIAFIQTDGLQLTLNQIQAFLKPYLPSYKIPIEVRFIPKEFLEKEMKLKRRELLVVRN